ncbi:MAG: dynamin family protein [Chloroflexi bacterium]|nr:dynamin family protein [Chloroflexota bacterium]MBP8055539.1 dynamin family protein [Chloroflexota bacterium]
MDTILDEPQEALLKQTRHILGQLRDVLASSSAATDDRTALADSLRQLDELFLLVIAGEFNSGKSSFINALLGHSGLLAEGVTPTTSHIHLLKYGETVTQTPREKGIWVHTAPVSWLRNINIVDTPGTNAILREHEMLTADFIPRSDLVLFLTSADRPFTESERAFLARIRDWGKKIVLLINKIDILDNQTEVEKVMEFVREAGKRLIGEIAAIFPISAKLAQKAKGGEPRLWGGSGFEPLERFIEETLDDRGRFRLKLLNPLGVGQKLVKKQLDVVRKDLEGLSEDTTLLGDIETQQRYYQDDMQRQFTARLSEIENLIYGIEKRGNSFFDETIRLGRITDLIQTGKIKEHYEAQVIGDTPQQIETRVGELVDWMVEQDLRQWSAVAEHLAQRRQHHEDRIIGQGGPREGTLAYDRQRLVDSIGKTVQTAIENYDNEGEAVRLAESARMAVVEAGLAGVGVGVGVAIALAVQVVWVDVTGIVAGLAAATLGLLILPMRRRKAKQELEQKLADLRRQLINSLTEQFNREMRRAFQRIDNSIAPFSRFVRAEKDRLTEQEKQLTELESHILSLRAQLEE